MINLNRIEIKEDNVMLRSQKYEDVYKGVKLDFSKKEKTKKLNVRIWSCVKDKVKISK